MEFSYELLKFTKLGQIVRCYFMKNFYFDVPQAELDELGRWDVTEKKGFILDCNHPEEQMKRLIDRGLSHLTCAITKNPTTYIHKRSGIPLLGNGGWGIVDRGSNIIEIKPVTGCNLSCTYCSLSEGTTLKKREFLIEADYIAEELEKVLAEKGLVNAGDGVEVHIGVHGEPFIYGDMVYLCKRLRKIPSVSDIATDTNGTFLTEAYIDELAEAGMTRINLSLDTLNPMQGAQLAGREGYSLNHVVKIAKYLAHHPKMKMLIAPVWMKGLNDEGMRDVIAFAKEEGIRVGIQNYLNYKGGRYLQREQEFDDFYKQLDAWEKEFNHQLKFKKEDFNIRAVKQISRPFKKGQTVQATVMLLGRLEDEFIAVAQGRNITLCGCKPVKMGQRINCRITRDKHNIFYGEVL